MAARLRDPDDQQWSQPVSKEGLNKLVMAIKQPKQPTDALRRLMSSDRDAK
jgi:hypothetical protein